MGMHDIFTCVTKDGGMLADNPGKFELLLTTGFKLTNAFDLTGTDAGDRLLDLGHGNEIACRLQVTTAYTGGAGDSLLTPFIVTSPAPGLSGGGERFIAALGGGVVGTEPAFFGRTGFVVGDLTQGAEYTIGIPGQTVYDAPPNQARQTVTMRRYLGVLFVVTGTAFATGGWTVHFGPFKGPLAPRRHAIGYSVP